MNAAARSILQFSLIGVALAGGFLGVLQARPAELLPFQGMVSVQIVNQVTEFAPLATACRFDCQVVHLNITIDSVMVHSEGDLNLTGGWLQISQAPTTLDIPRISTDGQLIGQGSLPPGNINLVRMK